MIDLSPDAQLVAAWETLDARRSDPDASQVAVLAAQSFFERVLFTFAESIGKRPLEVKARMYRMRHKRPQPPYAAVLAAITAGTDQ